MKKEEEFPLPLGTKPLGARGESAIIIYIVQVFFGKWQNDIVSLMIKTCIILTQSDLCILDLNLLR